MPRAAVGTHQLTQRERQHDSTSALGAQEHEGDEQVVPDPQELEDRERGERRDGQRQDDLDEHLEMGRAVDAGGLEQVRAAAAR